MSLFARMAERHPDGFIVLARSADGFVVVWANRAAALVDNKLALDAAKLARWYAVCDEALKTDRELEVDLPQPSGAAQATIVPLDATHVAVQLRPRTDHDALFTQTVHGVFFMRLDEPFHWSRDRAEQDAQLAYAFDHLRLIAVNDVVCQQMQRPREQLLGTPPSRRWAGDRERWNHHMRKLYDEGITYASVRAPRGNDEWFDAEGEYICTYADDGRITGHIGIQRDVTHRRHAQAELAMSRERLELATVNANIGIWEADVAERQMAFDPRWMARFGYGEVEGFRSWDWWSSVVHPEDLDEVKRAFADHVQGLTPLMRAEFRLRTADGSYVWILTTGRMAPGRPGRVLGISVDVTERKVLQERLAASERLAALGTLAAGVGHEINNPLTYVVLNLELMERKLPQMGAMGAGFGALIERARYGADRVGAVVRNLQTLARAETDRGTLANPVAVIERCLQIADHQIRHRAVVDRFLVKTPSVRCSEDRLVQVFLNLILNAVQAIPEGNADRYWIRVETGATPDGRALITISDNGCGIPGETLNRIFDPFFTTKNVGEGTGLGLSICRSIVASIGGEIDVESEVGRGSRFRVTLPAAEIADPLQPVTRRALSTIRRVLVIDDEPTLGALVKAVLDGVDVEVETTATSALARLNAGEHFDRILCDVMMPELTGMDFYEQVGEDVRPNIVFVSGGAFTERARTFLASVPNRRLQKPFDAAALAGALG